MRDLLKKIGFENDKAKSSQMSSIIKLEKGEKGKEVDVKTYQGMIGSLLYLIASSLDIIFSVCLFARFQSCPKESHLLAAKTIFHCLSKKIDLSL